MIFLEVFDNMPHDRVHKENGRYSLQSCVHWTDNALHEVKQPLTDPLIQAFLINKEVLEVYNDLPEKDPF